MKAMIVRSVYALVAAFVVAGGMLMTAKPAAAADEPTGCYLIAHQTKWGSKEIVIDVSGWNGHARHGDWWIADVSCEEEVAPII